MSGALACQTKQSPTISPTPTATHLQTTTTTTTTTTTSHQRQTPPAAHPSLQGNDTAPAPSFGDQASSTAKVIHAQSSGSVQSTNPPPQDGENQVYRTTRSPIAPYLPLFQTNEPSQAFAGPRTLPNSVAAARKQPSCPPFTPCRRPQASSGVPHRLACYRSASDTAWAWLHLRLPPFTNQSFASGKTQSAVASVYHLPLHLDRQSQNNVDRQLA